MRARGLATVVLTAAMLVGGVGVAATADSGTVTLPKIDPLAFLKSQHVPVQADGKPTAILDIGRFYTGPNGLEVRFNSKGTLLVAHYVVGADFTAIATALSATGVPETAGLIGAVVRAVASSQAKMAYAAVSGLLGPYVGDDVYRAVLKDNCLGVTVPPNSLPGILNVVEVLRSLAPGNSGTPQKKVVAWLEKCAPGDGPKADVAAPPPPPAANASDTSPVAAAQPVPAPAPAPKVAPPAQQPPAPAPAPPPPAPVPAPATPAPVPHDLDMNELCVHKHGDGASAHYGSADSPYTWYCTDSSGTEDHDLHPQEEYCDWRFPGTTAKVVPDGQIQAYWWKCVQ